MIHKKYNIFKTDLITNQFIDGVINEQTYLNHLNALNENIFSDIKEKLINALYSFVEKAIQIGFSIFDKLKTLLNWGTSIISSFKQKNPTLYKIIIITIITLILLIAAAASAHAAQSEQPKPINKAHLDFAIGFLDKYIEDENLFGDKSMIMKKAIAALMKLRDHHGILDFNMAKDFGKEAEIAAKAAIETANKDFNQAEYQKNVGDHNQTIFKVCLDMMKKGQEYIHYSYEHIKSSGQSPISSGSTETEKIGFEMAKDSIKAFYQNKKSLL